MMFFPLRSSLLSLIVISQSWVVFAQGLYLIFVDCLLLFFLWVVSTCVLICLVLLMDGFPSLILIYRVFLLLAVWSCYMGMHSYLLLLLFRMLWSILYTRRRASPPTLHMSTCKNISHIQALASNFFPTPPIKLKLGLQANTWETTNSSNPLGPIKPSSQLGFPVVDSLEFD